MSRQGQPRLRLQRGSGKVLEVASGSGEHCAFFVERFPGHVWQPTDPDPAALGSIASWCAGLDNVLPPLALDAASADWPVNAADAVLCINMARLVTTNDPLRSFRI